MQPTHLNNRYRLIRELGSSGFCKTFLVEDTQLPSGRRCVIKQLKPVTNNPQIYQLIQERFQREAAILEELGEGSAQIPKLYAYFSEKGQFYLVQEWIDGQTLADKMQTEGPLSESSVREMVRGLLPVLDYVHSKRLVHRDIKPDNIILQSSPASIPPTQPSPHYTPESTPPTVLSPQHSPGATPDRSYSVPPTEIFNQMAHSTL